MRRIELIENAKYARLISQELGVTIKPDTYPALVVLEYNPDNGVEGLPEVTIITWAQVVYMLLMKSGNRKIAVMIKGYLNRDLK